MEMTLGGADGSPCSLRSRLCASESWGPHLSPVAVPESLTRGLSRFSLCPEPEGQRLEDHGLGNMSRGCVVGQHGPQAQAFLIISQVLIDSDLGSRRSPPILTALANGPVNLFYSQDPSSHCDPASLGSPCGGERSWQWHLLGCAAGGLCSILQPLSPHCHAFLEGKTYGSRRSTCPETLYVLLSPEGHFQCFQLIFVMYSNF